MLVPDAPRLERAEYEGRAIRAEAGRGSAVFRAFRNNRPVPLFKDADEVYKYIGGLLEQLRQDPELVAAFRTPDTIFQYAYTDPDAVITIVMREGGGGRVDFGPTDLVPEVVMTMDADTAHRFWLGKINVTVALARGQMHAKGPVAKILKLVPLLKPVYPRYRQLLADAGRDDLLEDV
jgi:putative sterol carrier protein